MKKKLFILPVLSLALFATACSGNTNKELLETYEQSNDTTTETAEADLKAFASTTSSSDYDITCDFSGYADGAIYTVSPKKITTSYLTELADKIFDENSWSVRTPFEVASLSELEEELATIDKADELANEALADDSEEIVCTPFIYRNRIEGAIANNPDTAEKELKKDNCIVTYGKGEEMMSAALFKGKIGKEDYAFIYEQSDSDQYLNPMNTELPTPCLSLIKLTPTYNYMSSVIEPLNDSQYDTANIITSVAEEIPVDRQTALKQAEEFLAQVGFDNFTLIDSGKRKCSVGKNESTLLNGYSFSFTRQINAATCPLAEGMIFCNTFTNSSQSNGDHDDSHHDPESENIEFVNDGTYTPVEFIRVDVDADGIAYVEFYNLFDLGEAITEKPNLLTYEQAYEIFEEADIYPLNESKEPTKVQAQFSYIPLSYKDGFAYMPVWVFTETQESYYDNYNVYDGASMDCGNMLVAINAVDGTEIYNNGYSAYSLIFHDRARFVFK